MVVSKLMYGCGTMAWYQRECDDLEMKRMYTTNLADGYGKYERYEMSYSLK